MMSQHTTVKQFVTLLSGMDESEFRKLEVYWAEGGWEIMKLRRKGGQVVGFWAEKLPGSVH